MNRVRISTRILVFDNGTGWRLAIGIIHASRMNKIHGERVSNKLEPTYLTGITTLIERLRKRNTW